MTLRIRPLARKLISICVPSLLASRDQQVWMNKHAKETQRYLASNPSMIQLINHLCTHEVFRSNQKPTEISRLLHHLAILRPKRVVEIGSQLGGTLVLFAAVAAEDAQLLSIDLTYSHPRHVALASFIGSRQRLAAVTANSHEKSTHTQVVQWLKGNPVDLLFIDGDHTYNGVMQDYEAYGPLVRSGGVIAFHDINPDYRTRYGQPTIHDVGEVPQFWAELKMRHQSCLELIDDIEQDGYGIGMLIA